MQLGAANNWTCSWNNVSLYEAGDYKITIWAIDQDNNVNQSVYVIITITDNINPSVSSLIPTPASIFEMGTDIEINATITDIGTSVSSAKAMINVTIPFFNISMTFNGVNWTCTWDTSSYSPGDYNITIWAMDQQGNINQTESVIIYISADLTPPKINFIDPSNESIVRGPFNITVQIDDINQPAAGGVIATIYNGSITPFNLTMVRFGVTDQWTVKWDNLTTDYSPGDYYINITAIDYYSNVNSTGYLNITYYYDNTKPTITFIQPFNNTIITQAPLTITVNITDDNPPTPGNVIIQILNSTLGGLFNATMTYEGGIIWSYTWNNMSNYEDKTIVIRVWAIDSSPYLNVNNSMLMYITIDVLEPIEEEEDDDKRRKLWKEEEIPILSNIIDLIINFINDATTDPQKLYTKTENILIIVILAFIILTVVSLIKRRKGYKPSEKEKERLTKMIFRK